jgi:hypothetical protein
VKVFAALLALIFICGNPAFCQIVPASSPPTPVAGPSSPNRIVRGSKIFIAPMDGFESNLAAAILKKKVPVVIVDDASKADFIMTGNSHVDKAGWAKTIFISPNPHAEASISIKDAHTGNLVFAYNVDKSNAVRANQSTAEACAKHLKEDIEKK